MDSVGPATCGGAAPGGADEKPLLAVRTVLMADDHDHARWAGDHDVDPVTRLPAIDTAPDHQRRARGRRRDRTAGPDGAVIGDGIGKALEQEPAGDRPRASAADGGRRRAGPRGRRGRRWHRRAAASGADGGIRSCPTARQGQACHPPRRDRPGARRPSPGGGGGLASPPRRDGGSAPRCRIRARAAGQHVGHAVPRPRHLAVSRGQDGDAAFDPGRGGDAGIAALVAVMAERAAQDIA